MGLGDEFDDMKDKATSMMGSGDEPDEKIDQAAEKADKATGGKMSNKIDKGADAAKEGMDKLDQ